MTVRIEILAAKKIVGKRVFMTLTDNRTGELWKSFMPLRHTIKNAIGRELFSIQIFKNAFAYNNPNEVFEKWAGVQVTDFVTIPPGIDTLVIPDGLYAVFLYKGSSAEGAKVFDYIFRTWLPSTQYDIDNRPHFELLGEKYKNNDPGSEEEIWIPIKHK